MLRYRRKNILSAWFADLFKVTSRVLLGQAWIVVVVVARCEWIRYLRKRSWLARDELYRMGLGLVIKHTERKGKETGSNIRNYAQTDTHMSISFR